MQMKKRRMRDNRLFMTISNETAVPWPGVDAYPIFSNGSGWKSRPRADQPISGECNINKPMPPVVHYLSNGPWSIVTCAQLLHPHIVSQTQAGSYRIL
jgi:hypothetical protein